MRIALFYLVLLMMQGFLGALLSPLPPPDLFLLAALTLLWRVQPWQLVLIAYGVGLVQDMAGHGVLGVYALGLAGGVLAASLLRSQLSQAGILERILLVLAAVVGKWAVVLPLLMWLSPVPLASVRGALPIVPVDAVFTLLASLWILPWADALLERAAVLRKELL